MVKIFCITGTLSNLNLEIINSNNNMTYNIGISPINILIVMGTLQFNNVVISESLNENDIIQNKSSFDITIIYNSQNFLLPKNFQTTYTVNTGGMFIDQKYIQQELKKIHTCFTYETMQKILSLIKNNTEDYQIIKSKPGLTKVIKAQHQELGTLEFTENHPFYYNSEIITFDQLVKVNPKFTEYEILNENIPYVYNVYRNKKDDAQNYFKLSNDLIIIGAQRGIDGVIGCFFNMKNQLSNRLNHKNNKILIK